MPNKKKRPADGNTNGDGHDNGLEYARQELGALSDLLNASAKDAQSAIERARATIKAASREIARRRRRK